ncbi:MAG TPA: carboxypeptidase-like regulatory domain-containing protein, partial [Ilumatobacteraceae bacterium]|nr:carboxypeptidase-like regulatory domain-containing protein [Ilumatobacteraceae bacterium]
GARQSGAPLLRFADLERGMSLRIDLPTNCLAGEYLVSVQVVSIVDPQRTSEHEFWLTVEPLLAATITMHPSLIVGGSHAVFQASIANVGNVTADVAVNARDATRHFSCLAYPATVSVPAGETHTVEVHTDGKRPWFGDPIARPIDVEAVAASPTPTVNGDITLPATVTFTQKPRIPRGALTIAILAGIIALWAAVFLLVINALRDTSAPTKLTAVDFAQGGSSEIDLTAMASSLAGTVTSESTREPLPRITVEAYRVKFDASQELTGSAGTDDDGAFALESMLPGTYTLRLTADGFEEVWYPASPNQAGAEKVRITKDAPGEGLNVVMVGKPGSMSGQIVAPESQGSATSISLTITQQVTNPVEGAPLPEPVPVPRSLSPRW